MANKRLIDVDNAISHYKALANIAWNEKVSPVSWKDAFEDFVEYLEEAPTVDAVEVVRCKDCKYFDPNKALTVSGIWCSYWAIDPDPDDFCCKGERRSNVNL